MTRKRPEGEPKTPVPVFNVNAVTPLQIAKSEDVKMLTRAEATQQGMKFAEQWDKEKHSVSAEGIKAFAQELNSYDSLPAPQKNALKWAELRGATDGLIAGNVLPNLDVADSSASAGLRNCRIVGLTADGDKNSANDDLVVAIGRQKNNANRAESVVILGQDGKFYEAQKVKGGYVRTQNVIADNAAELETRHKRSDLKPKEQQEEKETPKPASPIDFEIFANDLHTFQAERWVKSAAQEQLNKLAENYCRLSKEQRSLARLEIAENNRLVDDGFWTRGFRTSRPQVAITRDSEGTIRFSADWNDGVSIFAPRNHRIYSQKFKLESR
jgi:hypothetical protein